MKPFSALILIAAFVFSSSLRAEELIEIKPDENGMFVDSSEPSSGPTMYRTPVPNIVSLEYYLQPGQENSPFSPTLVYNQDATRVVLLPNRGAQGASRLPGIVFECADKSGQQADGRILFTAADARVVGKTAKLESNPGNSRIGFWTNLDDRVEWDYEGTRPGTYRVTLCYSRGGEDAAKVQVGIGDETLTAEIQGTESWYRYKSLGIGKVNIPSPGKLKVTVKGLESEGALMNLKGIVLKPVSEGQAIQSPGDDGVIICHARDATIHGVKAQYEPKPEKNTVGYWTNVKDQVSWDVNFEQPGTYNVEILQGCGKGHGGSVVKVVMDAQALEMTVEDTGHFQNFKPRIIGQFKVDHAGIRRFVIVPVKKASVAVMDVRQVRLIPASQK